MGTHAAWLLANRRDTVTEFASTLHEVRGLVYAPRNAVHPRTCPGPPDMPGGIAWGAARLCRARTIAGGFGEAERSEGVAGRVVGAECAANLSGFPSQLECDDTAEQRTAGGTVDGLSVQAEDLTAPIEVEREGGPVI